MDSCTLIIFGITGNLAQTKLLPALYDLAKRNLLPQNFTIFGNGRKPFTKSEFEEFCHTSLRTHHHNEKEELSYKTFCQKITYVIGDLEDNDLYEKIKKNTKNRNVIFYLATYPDLYNVIFDKLKENDLDKKTTRIIIEKPFGNDLSSARKLNNLILSYFTENQIFRIDHYLGKTTLQNILAFRFGNSIFDDLFHEKYIDHIQITSAEKIGIEERGGYYDSVGALKDIGQNHVLQMLALATMDAPKEFTNEGITKERIAILKNLLPLPNSLILGQYEGYTEEKNVKMNSETDTFFAFKTMIDTPRYKNIPIYIRGGKRLPESVSEITIVFKEKIQLLNGNAPNVLIYRIQPNEGITLKIFVKSPGHTRTVEPAYMNFSYAQFEKELPSAYERLLYDAMQNDQTFFNDAPEIEAQWKFIDELVKTKTKVYRYEKGTWGPQEADLLIEKDGRNWINNEEKK